MGVCISKHDVVGIAAATQTTDESASLQKTISSSAEHAQPGTMDISNSDHSRELGHCCDNMDSTTNDPHPPLPEPPLPLHGTATGTQTIKGRRPSRKRDEDGGPNPLLQPEVFRLMADQPADIQRLEELLELQVHRTTRTTTFKISF